MNYAGKFDAKLSADGTGLHSQGHAHVETIEKHATHVPADAIIVPDAQLLFNGDFKRSGVDLILSRDDRELVLHDYFKGEKHATLSSPDGAHLSGDLVSALTGHTEYAQADGSASAGKVIGHVTKLAGTATATRNGVSVILHQGDNVEKGDVVQSGSDSTLGITFIDGTVFGLSSNARMVLNEMVYDPNGSNNSSLLSLVAGTITFVAGETAKHGDMKVDTPVATMGIRGTAVLVEIDFSVPGQGGAPDAKFQVLVEPDGSTGSYILFDKNTLTPLATVNQAGQQINITQGIVTITNAPLPPEVQKLINDVFTLKFTDNTNTKTFDHFTDTVIPQSLQPIMLASGATALPFFINVNTPDNPPPTGPNGPLTFLPHIPGPPSAAAFSGSLAERPGVTGSSAIDTVSGKVNFADINAGDRPTVSTSFASFTFQDAQHNNITANLSAQQLASIAALEINLNVVQDPGNNNNGSATWTYSVTDSALDFLGPGEILTLTYMARVDNNYGPSNEAALVPFTITIIGASEASNHAPTIAVTSNAFTELSNPTGAPTSDAVSGTISFTDADLTDRPVASAAFTSFTYTDAAHHPLTLTPQQLADIAAVEVPLTVTQTPGNTNNGSASWTYSLADGNFDFLAAGEVLTLTYTATVDDGHGGVVTKPFTVTITGTNDVPVITTGPQQIAFSGGTSVPGGNLTSEAPTSGTLAFADVDLSDTHTVSAVLASAALSGDGVVPPGPLNIFQTALTASIAKDSTGTGTGTINWNLADLPVYLADFIPEGETLTLTYAVTVTDSQNTTSTQNVVVTITGTDPAAVVWIATTTPDSDSPAGGLWSNPSNWETGTVPTAGDDAIIVTDQLHGLTPSFPVTIDAPAFARSVTMNDFGTTAPQLINQSTLTVGGAFNLSADSILDNAGTIKVGGLIELLNASVLQNSGTINLAQGGDFGAQSTVTNSGTIEVSGGTLNIRADVANAGGLIKVDGAAGLTLNGASIDGGAVTDNGEIDLTGAAALKNGSLGNSGKVVVSGSGNALDHETVAANSMLEILAGGVLLLDQGTTVANAGGLILVDGTATLTLDDASINGGTITDNGAIHIAGSSEIDGASLSNGGVTVDGGQTLKLDNVVVTGTTFVDTASGATLSVDAGDTLTLQGGASVIGGSLVNAGTVQIETTSGAMLDGVDVVNAGGTIQVDAIPASSRIVLTLEGGTTVTDGVLSIGNIGTVEIASGSTATLDGVTVNNGAGLLPSGLIQVDGTLEIDGVTINGGTIKDFGTINVTGTSTIHAANVSNSGMLEVTGGTLTIDAASNLNNDGTLEVNGGNLIVDPAFSGSARIVGASLLELGASFVGAYWFTDITFADGATGTLKLDHVESFGGTISGLDDNTLDLGDVVYGANVTAAYTGTADGGTLSIFENGIDVSDINLSGNYLGVHWVLADDGSSQHGTKVTEAPGAITGLDSHGNAIQGEAVTALVTDGGQSVTGATYQWQLDGHNILNATNAVYVPTESDEGHTLTVNISYVDALHNAETGSASAGTVQEAAGGDLVATLDSMTARDGVTMHVTGVTDGGNPVSTGLSYAWEVSSDDGLHWTTVGQASSFTPGEADEGKLMQLVVSYADATGTESSTYNLGTPTDLVATLDSTTATEGVAIHVTGVRDGGIRVSTGVSYAWQVSSDNGLHWSTVGDASSYTPVLADDGKALQVIVSYTDPGESESTTGSLGIVAPASSGAALQAVSEAIASPTNVIVATGTDQTLFGTAGSDTFAFNFAGIGHDTVIDFHPDTDALQFSASIFAKPQAVLDAIHDDGHGNTVIALDSHDTITLAGILKAQLSLSDFHTV